MKMAKKDENGNIAGIECDTSAEVPEGWTKLYVFFYKMYLVREGSAVL